MEYIEFDHSEQLPGSVPNAWGEPVVIGAEEPADTAGAPADDRFAPTELGVDAGLDHSADAPGGGDDVPPEIPGTELGETGPNRGEALQTVVAVAADSKQHIHDCIRNEVIHEAEMLGLGPYLETTNVSLDEAVEDLADSINPLTETSIRETVMESELARANEEHAGALAAAGLEFQQWGPDELALSMTDPDAYTEALEQVPPPENHEAQLAFNAQVTTTIDDAIARAASAIIADNPEAAVDACGDNPPRTHAFSDDSRQPVTDADRMFTQGLIQNADRLADRMEDIMVPHTAFEPMRQLALAEEAGLTAEWAAGVELGIIGNSDIVAGVDRLATVAEWEQVYSYLGRLEALVPNAIFTSDVRASVLGDIQAAIDGPGEDEPSLVRRLVYGRAEPMLRVAQAHIEHLMPRDY
jgi:hypothetical protein